MPVLKTPGGKGRLGGAVGGAADGAMDFLDYYLKKKSQERQNQFVTDREVKLKKMGQDYEDKKQAKLDLEKVPAFIGKINPDMTNSQLQAGLDVAGADTRPQFGAVPHGGSPDDLPSTQFGPVAAPAWNQALQARGESIDSLMAKNTRDNQQKYEGQYADVSGRNDANNANADTILDQEVNKANALGPIAARTAGETTGAQQDALNDPTRQKAHAHGQGLDAGAQAAAKQPYELARMKEQEAIRSAGMREDTTWKNDHTITGTTRTMMEGAKMILPRIDDVVNEAKVLDQGGGFGVVMSRVRQLGQKVGTEPEELMKLIADDPEIKNMGPLAGKFATEVGLMASGVGRVHGGARGGGSITMVNYMKSLLNDSADLPTFLGRMDGAKSYMEDYAAGPLATPQSHFNPADHNASVDGAPKTPQVNPAARFLGRP